MKQNHRREQITGYCVQMPAISGDLYEVRELVRVNGQDGFGLIVFTGAKADARRKCEQLNGFPMATEPFGV